MSRSKPITVNGVTYSSIRQAAIELNANYVRASARLRCGYTPEQAFEQEPSTKWFLGSCEVVVDDIVFENIKAAAEHYNVKYSTVCYRLETGRTIEQALGLEPLGRPNPNNANRYVGSYALYKNIVVKGKTYPSISKAAKELGLSKDTVYRRIKNGDTVEQAFDEAPSTRHRGKSVKVRGVIYPSIQDAAIAYNVSPRSVYKALRHGKTIEQALKLEATTPAATSHVRVTVENVEYPSIAAAAAAYNRPARAVAFALNKGKTVEEALGIVPHSRPKFNKTIVEGVEYPSIAVAAEHYNIDPKIVYQRIRTGWTYDKAFTVPPASRPWLKKKKPKKNNDKNLNKGKTVEEAPGTAPHSRPKSNKTIVEGVEYPSIAVAAEHYNIDPKIVYQRIRNGWTYDRAFTVPPAPRPWLKKKKP